MKNALIASLLATVTLNSAAALPPKYLSVGGFKQCLAIREFDGYRAWCIPAEKPQGCPAASWDQLKALGATDRLPDCPARSKLAAPSPAATATGPKARE